MNLEVDLRASGLRLSVDLSLNKIQYGLEGGKVDFDSERA